LKGRVYRCSATPWPCNAIIYIYIGPFQQDYYAGGVVKVKKVKVSATGKGKHTVFADE